LYWSPKRCGSKRTHQIHRNPFAVYRAKKAKLSSIWRAKNAAGTVSTAHNTRQDIVFNKEKINNNPIPFP